MYECIILYIILIFVLIYNIYNILNVYIYFLPSFLVLFSTFISLNDSCFFILAS